MTKEYYKVRIEPCNESKAKEPRGIYDTLQVNDSWYLIVSDGTHVPSAFRAAEGLAKELISNKLVDILKPFTISVQSER